MGSRFRWNASAPSLTRGSDDRLYLALPTRANDIVVVGGDGRGKWAVISHLGRAVSYARVAALPGGIVVLAYIGAYTEPGEADHNSVFVTRSVDTAETWSPPARIHRSGPEDGGHWPRLLAAGDSVLYLVWAQLFKPRPGGGDRTPDSLFVETSMDGGRSWIRIPSLGFPGGLADIDAAVDRGGSLHVAAMTIESGADTADVVFARWAGGRWSMGQKFRNVATPLTLSTVSADSLYATWTALRPSGGHQIPVTVLSTLGLCNSR